MRNPIEQRQCSSPEILDLWEHACLLFHSFEWQSAADTFRLTASLTSDQHEQVIFLLSQGLIEARLGDFDLALETWKSALGLDASDSITNFLVGLLCVETGEYVNSHAHFERSIANIQDGDADCRGLGLDFDLTATDVRRNVDILDSALQNKDTGRDADHSASLPLNRIPANIMFEPPPRNAATPQRSSNELQSSHLSAKKPGLSLLTPRDAQVHYESTRDLARFLRHAGPNGEANVSVDRHYMLSLLRGGSMGLSALDLNDQIFRSSMAPGISTLGQSNDLENTLHSHGVSNERHSEPTIATSMKQQPNTKSNSSIHPNANETSSSRRIAKHVVYRWLRKAARSPRRQSPTSRQEETTVSFDKSSSSEASSTRKAASHSLPSVVSSLEVFKLGARRRRASPG